MHYRRHRATGKVGPAQPKVVFNVPVLDRWESKVDKNGPIPEHRPDLGPCWLWTDGQDSKGYGRFKVETKGRKAHVVGYELLVGPTPNGLEPDHLCRVRHCVRPSHLEWVTHKVNVLRGEGKMARLARQTECLNGHPLDGPLADLIPDPRLGRRICRKCVNARRRKAYRRTGK